ncbi:MAG TPA: histidine kinase [Bacteroidetes bacterium]|nr:histidine kinase [Bacteroidota bacterium]
MTLTNLKTKISQYRFEINHILVFFVVLISFQVLLAFFQSSLVTNFLNDAQRWFQKYHAERVAIVTSASLENLFENQQRMRSEGRIDEAQMISSVNVIFKQLVLQRSIEEISLILLKDGRTYLVGNGRQMNDFFNGTLRPYEPQGPGGASAGVTYFASVKEEMLRSEKILSTVIDQKTFNVLVPFVPYGEHVGVLYIRISPDFTLLTDEVQSNFDRVSFAFSALVFVGLIIMYIVSSGAVKERNEARERLFVEHQANLEKQIRLEKESIFTKRIYHTHHKAEKIMGFIKNDVRMMNSETLEETKSRVIAYSNFISRIIYDMKWYDQDINTIINPVFHSNINAIIEFIVRNVFLRISSRNDMFSFKFDLDPRMPAVPVNEFIIWEILEPLIQNSIDHGDRNALTISISTRYDQAANVSAVRISDNGVGIPEELLKLDPKGVKRIFGEKETTGSNIGAHLGYGCYIAYQMAAGKCGWELDADNLREGGCCFTITIHHRGTP